LAAICRCVQKLHGVEIGRMVDTVVELSSFLGFCAAWVGGWLPTFRDNIGSNFNGQGFSRLLYSWRWGQCSPRNLSDQLPTCARWHCSCAKTSTILQGVSKISQRVWPPQFIPALSILDAVTLRSSGLCHCTILWMGTHTSHLQMAYENLFPPSKKNLVTMHHATWCCNLNPVHAINLHLRETLKVLYLRTLITEMALMLIIQLCQRWTLQCPQQIFKTHC
jgi:hypothetical protein